jgi:hypothetical protein
MTSPMPLMDQTLSGQQPSQEQGALGNRVLPPRRAIDKLLMGQQQQKSSMAFPQGLPPNQTPPQMTSPPLASSFMAAVLPQR